MVKLDYTLDTIEDRLALVNEYLAENPDPGEKYLEILGNYLVFFLDKQEAKERKLITENRMVTINKRETSLEGLVSQFENGEDGIYNLITNDKNIIFKPKIQITKEDLAEIPGLQQIKDAIGIWENILKTSEGKDSFIAKSAIIELRKDQYLLKDAYRVPVKAKNAIHSISPCMLDGEITIDENDNCVSSGITLINPRVVSAILCHYSALKQNSYGIFDSNTWYLMQDFDNVADRALKDYPFYERLVEYKIDGRQNVEIQDLLDREFGIRHSIEYISSLWRKKIPNLIASQAEDDYLEWYFLNIQRGKYKRCSRCGQIKLAHNKYFSKNKTSKDGFYSICKECRNIKNKEGVENGSSN